MVKENNGSTKIHQIDEDYFNEKELFKLKKNLTLESREVFFSKLVLLVEGETEFGAMPVFAEHNDFDFNNGGISIIFVGGKDNFEIYMKLLKAFGIPFVIMCDGDAAMKIERRHLPSIFRQLKNLSLIGKKDLETIKSLIKETDGERKIEEKDFDRIKEILERYDCIPLSDTFENVLKKEGYEELLKEAKNVVGKSKARMGRYIAEKIIENEGDIPKELSEVIEYVKKKLTNSQQNFGS